MVSITLKLLTLVLIFVQGIQSYCIYNQLTDGSAFDVSQANSLVPNLKTFKKYMKPYDQQCCPFTTSDCNHLKVNNDVASFYFYFYWPRYHSARFIVTCTSGGGLTIYGSETNYYAECVDAQGVTTKVDIIPAAVRNL